ncbi:MAG: GTP cyclohydrolase I [Rickettsiales bacterium]|jgi:GTP cyclohydrolase I|nr:GTP cyclohydrolase I [Rickettsiales bacterium]
MNLEKIEEGFRLFIEAVGDDLKRTGLIETPGRAARGFAELLGGYNQNDRDFYKTFECSNNSLVLLRDIEFTSVCEHHFLPFYGLISIGYIPDGRVLGLSKFSRIVDCFAKRLQIQENLVRDVGMSMVTNLKPAGLFVLSRAKHMCVACRGVNRGKLEVTTIFTHGKFADYSELDLLKLIAKPE